MTEVIATLDYSVDIFIRVRDNNLERSKHFLAAKIEVFDKLFKADLNGSWLERTINFGNIMFGSERFATK